MSTASLSLVADALAEVLDTGRRAVARVAGVSHSTPSRWGDDPAQWSLQAGLLVARRHPALASAILAALRGEGDGAGDAGGVPGDLLAEVEASGRVAIAIRAALADGRWSRAELGRTIAALEDRRDRDGRLIRDLRATLLRVSR